MGVPVFYAGSRYRPVPFVPIPPEPPAGAPQFSAAEVGNVNASTVAVTFDRDMSASDYGAGVTIKVNGTATSITSATRQSNHAIVRYVIPVLWHGSGDAVTWEYASGSGNIVAESGGAALGDISAQAVTNNCEYVALLDLQADTLALNDNDPVSTWADQSGNGNDFTQTGTARPTKQTINKFPQVGNHPSVVFDGSDDWMNGGDFAEVFSSATIIMMLNMNTAVSGGDALVTKCNNTNTGAGWAIYGNGNNFLVQNDGGNEYCIQNTALTPGSEVCVTSYQVTNLNSLTAFYNGLPNDFNFEQAGVVTNISSTDTVRLATFGNNVTGKYNAMNVFGVMLLSPKPAATNRAALEARLAARYGITL